MTNYFKAESNGYIIGVGKTDGEGNITEEEYNQITEVIYNKPTRDGYEYKLKSDLTWEEYKLEQGE